MNTVTDIRKKVEEVLTQERAAQMENAVEDNLSEHDRGMVDGWVEALEYVLAMLDKTLPTIQGWRRIERDAIVGLCRIAIAHIELNDADKAVQTLTRTMNLLRGTNVGEEE